MILSTDAEFDRLRELIKEYLWESGTRTLENPNWAKVAYVEAATLGCFCRQYILNQVLPEQISSAAFAAVFSEYDGIKLTAEAVDHYKLFFNKFIEVPDVIAELNRLRVHVTKKMH